MAFPRFLSLLIVTLSLFLTTSSRSVSTTNKTAVLDVVSSLKQAQEILTIDPKTLRSFTSQPDFVSGSDSIFLNSSSVLSLKLYSRDILFPEQHENYKSLVLSRLERDSIRVAEINSRIRIAVKGSNESTLKPVSKDDPRFQTEDFTTVPVISGWRFKSGQYFSRIGIGTPPQVMYMALDPGSDVTWIQCQPCTNCYRQFDPIFNPVKSSTYSSIACSDPLCKSLKDSTCQSNKCQYKTQYGDGSVSKGDFVNETISFGNSGNLNGIALGCGHDNQGLFIKSAGLFGLGRGAFSMTSQIKAKSFSYCLVNRDSLKSSTLDFNSPLSSGVSTATLLKNDKIPTFYYVEVSGISVDGEKVPISPSVFQIDSSGRGGVIMDCGTTVSRLPIEAYNSLRDSFIKHAKNLKRATIKAPPLDTCYDLKSLDSVKVPTVTLHFTTGKSLDLPPKNCLVLVDEPKVFCFAFAPSPSSVSIIGSVQQQGIHFTFDMEHMKMGFSPNQCLK